MFSQTDATITQTGRKDGGLVLVKVSLMVSLILTGWHSNESAAFHILFCKKIPTKKIASQSSESKPLVFVVSILRLI